MSLHVAVDFGTSSTCVAISVHGREPQVVVFDGQPLVPSAVFAAADGTLFVGQEAERQAAVDPARYEPHPKRRVDEGELLLGSTVLPVVDVVRAVLSRAVGEARRVGGGAPVDLLVLTHPADWGTVRTRVLLQAARGLGRELVLVPEPVAAAVFHSASHSIPDGAALAVLDLGGGTVDASVVARAGKSFRVLSAKGDPSFGGADIDQVLLEHVGGLVAAKDPEAWRQLVEGREMADRRKRRVLRQDVRGAKETLSRHAYTDVPMPPPFPDAHVTRSDLEQLITAPLSRAAALAAATVRDAGLRPQQLAGVFLVGGSSRIPLVARMVHDQIRVVPTSIDQPETVVARGALRAVSLDPERTGGVAQQAQAKGPSGEVTHNLRVGDDATRKITRRITPPPPGQYPVSFPAASSPPPRKSKAPLFIAIGVVVVLAAAGVGGYFWLNRDKTPQQPNPPGDQIAVYDYSFSRPDGWEQTGGAAGDRQVLLQPIERKNSNSKQPDARIAVQEQTLTYNSDQDRVRALSELKGLYQQRKDNGDEVADFVDNTTFAGKSVVHYREVVEATGVEWYIQFAGDVQVSVGCQATEATKAQVRTACEKIVSSLVIK
ncbi:type VII secretion-associated protein, Rv3446c family, C-terminal domain-containing protein [Lentzea waywayandensis]|uniref:Type VII secretion-associated protein, Rv3446c family, C-terminal domain-containing protein n=1 Tax=Lentzea waywayandensis TaxID=84724 RepID=A0A1I6DUL4_9PSEU|nr:type VII secretion-associated protein [Lentzea waywayandensis]SFR09047.1 type VII secretion-associated protein, Rv3446c family, C-terminal domain-containing protein [Lentzea waywayandensis]